MEDNRDEIIESHKKEIEFSKQIIENLESMNKINEEYGQKMFNKLMKKYDDWFMDLNRKLISDLFLLLLLFLMTNYIGIKHSDYKMATILNFTFPIGYIFVNYILFKKKRGEK